MCRKLLREWITHLVIMCAQCKMQVSSDQIAAGGQESPWPVEHLLF